MVIATGMFLPLPDSLQRKVFSRIRRLRLAQTDAEVVHR
jgi:hypothetical protein